MNFKKLLFILFGLLFTINSVFTSTDSENQQTAIQNFNDSQVLWYEQPAKEWIEALPIGNGRFGAMIFGDPSYERFQLNEDSLWRPTIIGDLPMEILKTLKESANY